MTHAVAFTAEGVALARRLAEHWPLELYAPAWLAGEEVLPLAGPVGDWAGERFRKGNLLLFVGAAGIAVRAIAPFIWSKDRDPAVLCVDEAGRFVVPLLGGHLGGANGAAERIAVILGAQPVLTTASEVRGGFSFDRWAAEHGCAVANPGAIKRIAAALLAGEAVGLHSAFPVDDPLPEGVDMEARTDVGVSISLQREAAFPHTLHLIPRCLVLGVGCRRGTDPDALEAAVRELLERHDRPVEGVGGVATIDRKADEPAVLALAERLGVPLRAYTAEQLAAVPGAFAASDFVRETVGVDNVCERAAAMGGGELIVPKTVIGTATLAVARWPWRARFEDEDKDVSG